MILQQGQQSVVESMGGRLNRGGLIHGFLSQIRQEIAPCSVLLAYRTVLNRKFV